MIYGRRSVQGAKSQYQETDLIARIENASPHSLVALLYDQLGESLDVVSALMARNQAVFSSFHANRARSILVALLAGLDFQKGGEVAVHLSTVYRTMLRELDRAIAGYAPLAISEIRRGLRAVSEAWAQLQG